MDRRMICFFIFAAISASVYGQDKCNVQAGSRVDCGDVTTTPDGCVAKGCCWNVTTVPNAPNCFFANDGGNQGDPTCSVDGPSRTDCGDVSTTPEQCVEKGCCWEVTPGAPYCFYKGQGGGGDSSSSSSTDGPTPPPPTGDRRIYIHMMPWFESKDSNGGTWGMHWTMANKNPDNMVNGMNDIASYYHPIIGPYASSDPKVIDWQLGLMKLSGVTGVLMDWPGTSGALDYGPNLRNAEAIINACQAHGLEFGIVYEDHNLDLAGIGDKIGQGTKDMDYIQTNYVSKGNYARYNDAPLLLTFGPQSLFNEQWDQIFTPFTTKPTFLILADKDLSSGGSSCKGGFAWIWPDYLDGLQNIYNKPFPVKMGVAYPGFNAFYAEGGWGDIPWKIPVDPSTFQATLDLAWDRTDIIQVATWNDYGEGTIIEPTHEFEYAYLEIMQKKTGVPYTVDDLKHLTDIFNSRVRYASDPKVSRNLERQHFEFVHRKR